MRYKLLLPIIAIGCSLAFSGEPTRVDHQIPLGWSELGLSNQQLHKIQAVKADFRPELDQLVKKLKKLQGDEHGRLLEVLTGEQKTKLAQIAPAQPTFALAYSVQIMSLQNVKDWRKPKDNEPGRKGRDAVDAVLVFDKQTPRGACTAIVDLPNRKVVLDLLPDVGDEAPTSKLAKRFRTFWVPGKAGFDPKDLVGKTVTVYAHGNPPGAQSFPLAPARFKE